MGDYPGLFSGPNVITWVFIIGRGRQKNVNQKEDTTQMLLALKVEELGRSRAVHVVSIKWKRQGNEVSSRASERKAAWPTP